MFNNQINQKKYYGLYEYNTDSNENRNALFVRYHESEIVCTAFDQRNTILSTALYLYLCTQVHPNSNPNKSVNVSHFAMRYTQIDATLRCQQKTGRIHHQWQFRIARQLVAKPFQHHNHADF